MTGASAGRAVPASSPSARRSTTTAAGADGTTAKQKATAKQTPAKKSTAKKSTAKKAPATKATAKKATSNKATAKKAPATKATAKKATAKKATAKKATAKKATAKKATAKKAAPQRAAASQPAATAKRSGGPPDWARSARPSALRVREDESPWTEAELDDVREELAAEIERLRAEAAHADAEIADLLRDAGDGAGDDQADSGSKAFEREHEMTIANNTRDLVTQNAHALERIADGSYGTCESCGRPIGKRRLQAFPRATLCLECKQRQERH